jgi:glycosyltransferase involved in cell wall biosynthesis
LVRNKKILLTDLAVPFGGMETYLVSLAKLLKGHINLSAICVNPHLAEMLRGEGVRVVPNGALTDRGKLINMIIAAVCLVWMRFCYGYSMLWVNGNSEIALLPIARLLGCKAVATRHLTMDVQSKEWASHPSRKIAQRLYENFAFTANRIFCVSGRVARDMVKIVNPRKVTVIPNWVREIPNADPISRADGQKVKLLFVGRLERYKGASLILEAMRGIEDRVSLTIVGEGPNKSELEKMAAGLDVTFAGFQTDTARFYRETDIFINPSVGPEGLPLVSLEAMSFGLPCILSALDVHLEISADGRSAALFAIADVADLRSKITELVNSPKVRKAYGREARAAIMATHSPQVARSAYLRQIESLDMAA